MDFAFTKEQQKLREEIHDFLVKEPKGELMDSEIISGHSPEFVRKLASKGWLGIAFPKEYGGLGLGPIEQIIFKEEMGYTSAPVNMGALGTTVNLCSKRR